MTEPRRVQLNSVPAPFSTGFLKKPPEEEEEEEETGGHKKKVKEPEVSAATVRLALTLFEPDHKRCPEFYYPELLKDIKPPVVKKEALKRESDDPFNDEEKERQEVAVLAKRFEEKYGSKKRRRDRIQDLIDMGYGYDDSDSFIDNSEAYDELVPASLNTKYGGFYINSGTLQFRQASDSDDNETGKEKKKLKSPKKRKLKDGSEKIKKKKKDDSQVKEKKARKSKPAKTGFVALNASKEDKKKKKKHSGYISVKEMLKKFEKEKEAQQKREDLKSAVPLQPATSVLRETENSAATATSDPLLSLIGSANASELLEAATDMDSLTELDFEQLLYESPVVSPFNEMEDSNEFPSPGQAPRQAPGLPEGLPASLEKRIKDLTQAAKASEGEGKQKFFTQDINSILLDIELLSRELNPQARSGVYAHLASFLPCSKDTLIKRAKKLHLNEQDVRLKEPLQKLKEAVGRVMPQQMAKYQEECQAHTQAKFAKMLEEEKEKEQKERVCSDEEEDEEKGGKRIMGPRKKFHWTDNIRDLLCNVVKIKMGSYELERNKAQSPEDYLKAFLEAEVKPLWPKGWMQSRTLFKESRRVHAHLTSMLTKKKVIAAPKLKDPILKLDRRTSTPLGTPVTSTGNTSTLHPSAGTGSLTSLGGFLSFGSTQNSTTATPLQSFSKDDSLDEDLIHKPPSLEAVSQELAALNSGARGSPDFSLPVTQKPVPDSTPLHEKKLVSKPAPPTSAPSSVGPPSSPLNLLAEQALTAGHFPQEKKQESSSHSLIAAYKGLSGASSSGSKVHSETPPAKPKLPGLPRVTQAASSLQSLSIKPFHHSSPQQKSFTPPVHFSISKLVGSSQTKTSPLLQQRALYQHTKTPTKLQPFHATSASSTGSSHGPPTTSAPKAPSSSTASVSYGQKQPSNSSSTAMSFKPAFSLPTSVKHSVPSSCAVPVVSSVQSSISASSLLNRQSPSPSQSSSRPLASTTVKKSSVPQKLTLVAPPGGTNGESGGVAKLLTSSLKPAMASSSTATTVISSLRGSSGTATLTSSPSLSLLSSSFTSANQKLSASAGLNPAPLGIIPSISSMHSFPLQFISFGSEPAAKPSASKDAVVTGPAPGTFHHGLAHSIFAGLSSSPYHALPLPPSALSAHSQPSRSGNLPVAMSHLSTGCLSCSF
nr:PREDICTED: ubinuclein-1 isoform X2 [Latimeria chalumnae]|eukprot:XP_006013398.1 PREDICTED: ubinuclein-1 isoform X2 [Latimeria chalumnae]